MPRSLSRKKKSIPSLPNKFAMKFLIDENVGNTVVRFLKNKGQDVIVASKKGLSGREDEFLLGYAFKEGRIIITNDKDFGFLIYRQKMPSRGIILFRFVQELPSLKVGALNAILSLKPEQILNHFIIASEGKIRIRPLK
jgi:predicted nuclease of predicted toxin-antitoxin system